MAPPKRRWTDDEFREVLIVITADVFSLEDIQLALRVRSATRKTRCASWAAQEMKRRGLIARVARNQYRRA